MIIQLELAPVILLAVAWLWSLPRRRSVTIGILFLLVILNIRYIVWRTLETLHYHDLASYVGALILYSAEVYSVILTILGLVVNLAPLSRDHRSPNEGNTASPSVDVLIPSYNEAPEILATTVVAATQMRYPRQKLKVYLLDDGGTDQKRRATDPAAAAAATERHRVLNELCHRFGAIYLTRERNEHAKAGNLNAALAKTTGDLVLILDADHVPTTDFLERTVHLFADPKLFLVQTPHFLINADPIERNLNVFLRMPAENEMFYRAIQNGLDTWNASFFCGSAALLRRNCLEEIGGFQYGSITEDAETALLLHGRGYRSAFVGRPMVAGLAPETFTGFITQRVRWGQGMLQILLMHNPLLKPGLSIWQRIGYLNSTLYWLFPFARVIFLVAPTGYLLFGLKIYDAELLPLLVYGLPHVIASMTSTTLLFGRVRWPLIAMIYEVTQSLFALPALVATVRRPHAPNFKVTPKGEQLDEDMISPLARPFYWILATLMVATLAGAVRYALVPLERHVVAATLIWNVLGSLIVLAAVGALFERRQRRASPRVPADIAAILMTEDVAVPGRIVDLSMGGALFEAMEGAVIPNDAVSGRLTTEVSGHGLIGIPISLRSRKDGSRTALGLAFNAATDQEFRAIVALVHGDSERWLAFWRSRSRPISSFSAARILASCAATSLWDHIRFRFLELRGNWRRPLIRLGLPEGETRSNRQDRADCPSSPERASLHEFSPAMAFAGDPKSAVASH